MVGDVDCGLKHGFELPCTGARLSKQAGGGGVAAPEQVDQCHLLTLCVVNVA